ncbi:sushi, von Willebrand factor type A, EGF and pentraxin domain-containing protein 1-like [Actinia tenebrosa]|uniref:Sushi, von Willebrand factor type A, EGF and pentraxin domain-containing protein 1-like n=1 Tax=Actinia tenebrosa TaxID=6105 RepID=A0A6P8H5W0_ACTTE|nr:sushi, von Willebrand factor type A, EGF and pentraxin domain-containing protein 1-like [Actinia tenebrosa]
MDLTLFFYVTLIILILKADKTVSQCKPKRKEFDKEFSDLTLTSKILGSLNTKEVICQYSCHSHENCDAYNYNLDDGRGEVLDARSSFFNVVMRKGWIFRASKCESDPCLNGGTCFHAIGKDRCLCPCQWKGKSCDVPITNSDYVMSFPGGSVNDLVVFENPFPVSLSMLSVSMWFQIDPAKDGQHALLSYATSTKADTILAKLKPTLTQICIYNDWGVTGNVVLYINGVKRGEKANVATGETIGNGALVLGQDQDSYKGGYDPNQAFKGNLTSLNMWNRVLTASEISDLARKCPTQEGNILTWTKLMSQPRLGNVNLICSTFCVPQ